MNLYILLGSVFIGIIILTTFILGIKKLTRSKLPKADKILYIIVLIAGICIFSLALIVGTSDLINNKLPPLLW